MYIFGNYLVYWSYIVTLYSACIDMIVIVSCYKQLFEKKSTFLFILAINLFSKLSNKLFNYFPIYSIPWIKQQHRSYLFGELLALKRACNFLVFQTWPRRLWRCRYSTSYPWLFRWTSSTKCPAWNQMLIFRILRRPNLAFTMLLALWFTKLKSSWCNLGLGRRSRMAMSSAMGFSR